MAKAARDSLQAALRSLQQQITAIQHGNSTSGCSEQIEQLTSHVESLLHTHAEVQQALENKSVAERALRNVVACKEAEAARLRGEVQRLRRSQTPTTPAAAAEHATAPQPPTITAAHGQHSTLADDDAAAAAVVDSPGRQAVLEEAVPAKDKPTALVHQLQSEVSACQSRITALECELAAATTEHNARLAQQQKAFLAKLEQLRQVHVQQVAAASEEAQKHVEQHAARSKQVEEQLLQSKQQQLKQQDTIMALREELRRQQHTQVSGAKKQLPPCPAPASDASAAADTTTPATNQALGTNSTTAGSSSSRDQPPSAAAAGSPTAAASSAAQSKAEARAAAAAEVAALKDMEAQLLRLSTTVKSYQAEREQLRQAFMAGCAERQALQQQVQELTRMLQGSSASGKLPVTMQPDTAAAAAAAAPGSLAIKLPEASEATGAYWGSLS